MGMSINFNLQFCEELQEEVNNLCLICPGTQAEHITGNNLYSAVLSACGMKYKLFFLNSSVCEKPRASSCRLLHFSLLNTCKRIPLAKVCHGQCLRI